MSLDVAALRAREYAWMDAGEGVYLNAASTGPMPQSAVDAATEWAHLRQQPQRIALARMFDAVATSRRQFAALVEYHVWPQSRGAGAATAAWCHPHVRR